MISKKIMGDSIPSDVNVILKVDNIIFNYTRDIRTGHKTGVIIACKFQGNDEVFLGWSKCDRKDIFSNDSAFNIALYRAYSNYMCDDSYESHLELRDTSRTIPEFLEVPPTMISDTVDFLRRAYKYFYAHINQTITPDDIVFSITPEEIAPLIRSLPDDFVVMTIEID